MRSGKLNRYAKESNPSVDFFGPTESFRRAGFVVHHPLNELSAKGDTLERLNGWVDFELFWPDLERAVPPADRSRGGRPPFDHVLMPKVMILQASHSLSDERTEFLIKDPLSFMRFLGLGLADPVADANTIWTFREALTRATMRGRPAIDVLFGAYEAALTCAGFLAMGGQIVDVSIIAALKQRNTSAEKRDIKEGRISAGWADKPAKLAQKDRDARWTQGGAHPGRVGGQACEARAEGPGRPLYRDFEAQPPAAI